jgi:hypothetical protein
MLTSEQIIKEVQDNKEYILAQKYPEDLAGEYAESAMPYLYSELYREWRDLPEEASNQFHNMITDLPDRIEDLMHADLYLYYYNEYSGAIAQLVQQQECEPHTWTLQLNMPNTPEQNYCEECGATEPADPHDVAEQKRLLEEQQVHYVSAEEILG